MQCDAEAGLVSHVATENSTYKPFAALSELPGPLLVDKKGSTYE